jgi:hypothetical protein
MPRTSKNTNSALHPLARAGYFDASRRFWTNQGMCGLDGGEHVRRRAFVRHSGKESASDDASPSAEFGKIASPAST